MTEYKPIEAWKRSWEDEEVQLEALFDSLYAVGKVSEKDVAGLLAGPYKWSKGYLLPRWEAARLFLRENWDNESFLKKMNCYHNSPIDLANQIYGRTRQSGIGTVTYTCTGVPAIVGKIVCMGKMEGEEYITNPPEGAPRQFVNELTPNDILMFLIKYGARLKDPLLMFGVWRTYPASSATDYGPWMMCLCHHLGLGVREYYYEYGFDANFNTIDYIGPRSDMSDSMM